MIVIPIDECLKINILEEIVTFIAQPASPDLLRSMNTDLACDAVFVILS